MWRRLPWPGFPGFVGWDRALHLDGRTSRKGGLDRHPTAAIPIPELLAWADVKFRPLSGSFLGECGNSTIASYVVQAENTEKSMRKPTESIILAR
jgi:hypothetical protein